MDLNSTKNVLLLRNCIAVKLTNLKTTNPDSDLIDGYTELLILLTNNKINDAYASFIFLQFLLLSILVLHKFHCQLNSICF